MRYFTICTLYQKLLACNTHGEMRNAYKILAGKPEGKGPLEDLGVDGRIILN
jgi:hypothetical protein